MPWPRGPNHRGGSFRPSKGEMENIYMSNSTVLSQPSVTNSISVYSDGEKIERRKLGLPSCEPAPTGILRRVSRSSALAKRSAIKAPQVLNEACEYGSAFTRGLRLDLPG